jgi:alkylation response protein AidB-like acyl-CoA dehydrogenase
VTLDGRGGGGLRLLELDELYDEALAAAPARNRVAGAFAAEGVLDDESAGFAPWLRQFSGGEGGDTGTGNPAAPGRGEVAAALQLARRLGGATPWPGRGETAAYLETLATVAAADVTVARVVEPHLDALAILAECPVGVDRATVGADRTSTWGVFAAEGPGVRLEAAPAATGGDAPDARAWVLAGTKPWCSLAGELTHALVTAHVIDGEGDGAATDANGGTGPGARTAPGQAPGSRRRLFAVALRQDGVRVHPGTWVARGLPAVPSGPVDFDEVTAVPVGEAGWYLERAGFEWGGVGVAAGWYGGAVGVARRVVAAAAAKGDDITALHAGRCATALFGARSALGLAAARIDSGELDRDDARILAQAVRSVVRRAAETVLHEAGEALGPAPLALDAAHAARVADLELYLRQDHGARDEARLGRLILDRETLTGQEAGIR